jgi:phosphatidylglycerophosphate synthase
MAAYRTWVPNALSISRVPAALAFLVVYSSSEKALYFSALGIAFVALMTDVIDGPLARRWCVTSEQGYFLDGLGDKAFYIGVLVTMIREQVTSSVLAWVLIAREVFLYALRTLDQSRAENLKSLRFYSKAYALFIRLYCRSSLPTRRHCLDWSSRFDARRDSQCRILLDLFCRAHHVRPCADYARIRWGWEDRDSRRNLINP